ncbi:MAG TPA: hypothetical protein VI072_29110 [Polyangiaceae bacterium]
MRAAWLVAWLVGSTACQSRDEPARGSPPQSSAAAIARSATEHARVGIPLPELDRTLTRALAQPERSVSGPTLAGVLSRCAGIAVDTERQQLLRSVLFRHLQPSMVSALAGLLARPLPSARDADEPSLLERRQCELFRQSLAVELLGVIAAPESVEPVIRVLLDTSKAELHALCTLALLRTGAPAERRAIALLARDDEHLPVLASVLGQMRTTGACAALGSALSRSRDVAARARLAIELVRCRDAAVLEKYRSVHETTPGALELGAGVLAHEALAEAAVGAFDDSLVPWLLERARTGLARDRQQSSELFTAIRLMTPEQMPAVRNVVRSRRVPQELEVFVQAAEQLKRCERLLSCYVVALSEPSHQQGTQQVRGVKAAIMLGVLGNEPARDAIIRRYPRIQSPLIRFWAAQAVGHLTRQPSEATLAALDDLTRHADAGAPQDLALEQVLWRLRLQRSR